MSDEPIEPDEDEDEDTPEPVDLVVHDGILGAGSDFQEE